MQQFDAEQLQRSWAAVVADLERATATLPERFRSTLPAILATGFTTADFRLLEAVCNQLDLHSKQNPVTREFCLAMCDASVKLALYDRASRYKSMAAAA